MRRHPAVGGQQRREARIGIEPLDLGGHVVEALRAQEEPSPRQPPNYRQAERIPVQVSVRRQPHTPHKRTSSAPHPGTVHPALISARRRVNGSGPRRLG